MALDYIHVYTHMYTLRGRYLEEEAAHAKKPTQEREREREREASHIEIRYFVCAIIGDDTPDL
jgi:hypothetical protein